MGKNTKVNKQSLVMFWLNWTKYGAVSYSFSCTLSCTEEADFFFLFLQLKLWVFNISNDIWFTFDSYMSHSFYTFAAVFSIVLLFPWIEATTPLFSTVCIPCSSTCSSDLSNGVLPDDFQNQTILGSKQVNSGKNGEKHKSKQTISCHVLA